MTNFIPHETKLFNYGERPWIHNKLKAISQQQQKNYQLYLKDKSNMLATKLETLQNMIYETMESCKSSFYENIMLCSKAVTPKYYWSLLKTILNEKKIPSILPIIHNNNFVTNFGKKDDIFNYFFSKQC